MRYFLFVSTFFSIMLLTMHMALLPGSQFQQPDICPSGVPEQYQHLEPGKIVSAYFLSWHGKKRYTTEHFERIAHKITHLIYAFVEPQDDGSCKIMHPRLAFGVGYNYAVESGHFDQLREIKKRHPHLKILLSVGGGGSNQTFVNLYRDNKLKDVAQAFVDTLGSYSYTYRPKKGVDKVTTVYNYEDLFDGIDINWEFSPRGVKEGYAQSYCDFVKEMRRLLDIRQGKLQREMMLSATLQISPAVYRSLPVAEISNYINWFHLMSYDIYGFNSGAVGHNSPICGSYNVYTIDGAVNRIIHEGVSPDKLVLGLSGYGHKYVGTKGYGRHFDKKNSQTKSLFFRDIQQYFEPSNNYEKGWASVGRVPYLQNKEGQVFISYDDRDSFVQKIGLAANKRCAGVMFWALSHDDDDHTLTNAMGDHVGQPFII